VFATAPDSRSRNLFTRFSLILLLYAVCLAIGSVAGFPESMKDSSFFPYLSDKPVGEDGFYMLTVAYNIATGKGISYNMGIVTTGVQPLATFLFALLAKLNILLGGDKWSFIRVIILAGGVVHVFFSYLIGQLSFELLRTKGYCRVISSRGFTLASGLAIFSMGLFKLSTYGLETSIYLSALTAGMIFFVSNAQALTNGDILISLKMGLLIGISILARIDAAIIWILFYAIIVLRRAVAFKGIFYSAASSFAISIPWFIFVYSVNGSFIPSSGGAQSSIISFDSYASRLLDFAYSIASHASVVFAPGRTFLVAGSTLVILAYFALVLSSSNSRKALRDVAADPFFNSFSVSIILLCLIYPLFFWASHFYFRYTSPLSIIFIPLIACSLSAVASDRKAVLIIFAGLVLFAGQAVGSFHSGTIGNNHSISAGYVNSNFKNPSYVVGAYQSGVIGYFNDNTVNLDGKLDPLALRSLRNSSIHIYALRRGVNVIVDWRRGVEDLQARYMRDGGKIWRSCPLGINNDASICIMSD